MGGLSPFAQALGGLGAGVQGFAQGRQIRDEQQMQQQQLADDRTRNAVSTLGILQQLAQGGQATQDPAFQQQVLSTLGQAGIHLNAMPQGFGQTPFSELLLKNPDAIGALRGLDPAMRSQADAGISGLPQGFNDAPPVMDPKEARELYGSLRQTYQMAVTQGADPQSPGMMSLQKQMSQLLQGIPGAPADGADTEPLITGPTKTQVGITHTNASTANLNANTQYREDATKWMNTLGPARLQNLIARTNLTQEQFQMLPMRVNIAMMNAVAHQTDVEQKGQQLAMQISDFNKLGVRPEALSAYNGLERNMQAYANQARVAKDAAQKAITTILGQNAGQAPQPKNADGSENPAYHAFQSAQQAYAQANNQLFQAQHQADAFQKGYAPFAKAVNSKLGAPNSWSPPKPIPGTAGGPSNSKMQSYYPGSATKDGKPRWLWSDGTYHTSPPPKQ